MFVLEGEVALTTPDGTSRLRAGDYALLPVGVAHAWRAATAARWAELQAPQARSRAGYDTVFVPRLPSDGEPSEVDVRDAHPRVRAHRPGGDGPGKASAGSAARVGQHAHSAARLQRHRASR